MFHLYSKDSVQLPGLLFRVLLHQVPIIAFPGLKLGFMFLFPVWISICPLISPGNGLFETLILPIQRKTSLLYVQLLYSSAQPIFETLVFVITIQKHSSKPPVFALSLVHHQQIQPKQGHSIPPRNSSLRDIPTLLIQRFNPSRIRLYILPLGRTSL